LLSKFDGFNKFRVLNESHLHLAVLLVISYSALNHRQSEIDLLCNFVALIVIVTNLLEMLNNDIFENFSIMTFWNWNSILLQ